MKVFCRSALCVVIAVPVFGLLGCAVLMKPVRMTGLAAKDLTVQVTIDAGANQDSVVAADVVAVDDKKVLGEVSAMTATQWFAKKNDMIRMKGKDLKIVSWEFVPGTIVPDQHLTVTIGKTGVILFANYAGKGEHRATLPQTGRVQVDFGADDFAVRLPKATSDATPTQ